MTAYELVHGINLMGGYIDVWYSHWHVVRDAECRGLVKVADHRKNPDMIRVSVVKKYRRKIDADVPDAP